MKCSRCQTNMHKNGTRDGKQRWLCPQCKYEIQERKKSLSSTKDKEYGIGSGDALFCGDAHEPFCLDEYPEFCARIRDKYKIETVYSVGDLTDQHYGSRYGSDPDGYGGGDEIDMTIHKLQRWYKLFPSMKICGSNHDLRYQHNAFKNSISKRYLKGFLEVYEAPDTYEYKYFYKHDDIRIFHGTGFSGEYGHINAAKRYMQKVVIGHLHCVMGFSYMATEDRILWGMATGCGIDRHAYSMAYGKDLPRKPVIGCAAIIDGAPYTFPMEL